MPIGFQETSTIGSVGWGIIGIAMDTDMNTGCVADMQRLGYVPMRDAWLGLHTKHGTAEIVRFSPKSHAPDAGIRVGDVVLKVDDRPALPWPERMRTLEGKKAGERVDGEEGQALRAAPLNPAGAIPPSAETR